MRRFYGGIASVLVPRWILSLSHSLSRRDSPGTPAVVRPRTIEDESASPPIGGDGGSGSGLVFLLSLALRPLRPFVYVAAYMYVRARARARWHVCIRTHAHARNARVVFRGNHPAALEEKAGEYMRRTIPPSRLFSLT